MICVFVKIIACAISVECSRNVREITSENIINPKSKTETGQGTKFGTYADALSTKVKVRGNKNGDPVSTGLNENDKNNYKNIHPGASENRSTG